MRSGASSTRASRTWRGTPTQGGPGTRFGPTSKLAAVEGPGHHPADGRDGPSECLRLVRGDRSRPWLTVPLERGQNRREARGPALRLSRLLSRGPARRRAALALPLVSRFRRLQGGRPCLFQRPSRSSMDSASAQAAPGHMTAGCSSTLGGRVEFRPSHGIVGLLALVVISLSGRTASAGDSTPGLVLWAWERPEDLTFLTGSRTAVAFLASTIRLEGGGAEVFPRRQPLRVLPKTPLVAVVRVERGRERPSSPTPGQRAAVVAAAVEAAGLPRVSELQLDWDAVTSERDAYAAGSAPSFFCREALAFARRFPSDLAAPELLHLAVTAGRVGCRDDDTARLSNEAFRLLHSKWRGSGWAKKTPYWYEGR